MLTNKYAEGYPGRRYYGGCEVVDEVERIAIERAKALFGAEHANVQPHAGAQANMAAYHARARRRRHRARAAARPRRPPDARPQGQLLGHALPLRAATASRADTERIDIDEVRRLAQRAPPEADRGGRARPTRGVIDFAALPRDRRRGRRAVHGRHGAHLGPRRGRRAPEPRRVGATSSPRPRTRRSPARAPGFILCRAELGHEDRLARSSRACRAGRCATPRRPRRSASRVAGTEAFRDYQRQVRGERRRPGRDARSRAATGSSPAAPTRTSCCSTCATPSGRAGRRGPPARRRA